MMNFIIASTFQDSLLRLSAAEQKATKLAAYDLQINPAKPSLSFHRLDKARDKKFWSVRVNSDVRIIVHRDVDSLTLCFVDHHDQAYAWAERRKLEVHPRTGAAQIVEIREIVQEILAPTRVAFLTSAPAPRPRPTSQPLARVPDDELLGYGVPADWVAAVKAANEDDILLLEGHLPAEAMEAVLELACGRKPRPVPAVALDTNPFSHPDAQRRFRVLNNVEELTQALDFPWDKWTVFLHPEQHALVERDFNGPARVGGSAGTGKTVVALHRAVYLAKQYPSASILLCTFSAPLANALSVSLRRLLGSEPRLQERIEVFALDGLGARLYQLRRGPLRLATREEIKNLTAQMAAAVGGHRFTDAFVMAEWEQVVDAWQVKTLDSYREVPRLGRKVRLPDAQRLQLWSIFERVLTELARAGWLTSAGLFSALVEIYADAGKTPFDYAVVDEAQDIGAMQLRALAAIVGNHPNALFFAGDIGQRIFQTPFSWKAQGVDIRGRARTLRVNYRTSHQIRQHADRLLNPEIADVDGNAEDRGNTISVFNGPAPTVACYPSAETECAAVADWLQATAAAGVPLQAFGVFVRSEAEIPRAVAAVTAAGLQYKILDEHVAITTGYIAISTMHLAKGLEFRAVAVMACDEDVLPLISRLQQAGDKADLEEVYDTERQLLYVACTRARDQLLVTGTTPGSEFLEDLAG